MLKIRIRKNILISENIKMHGSGSEGQNINRKHQKKNMVIKFQHENNEQKLFVSSSDKKISISSKKSSCPRSGSGFISGFQCGFRIQIHIKMKWILCTEKKYYLPLEPPLKVDDKTFEQKLSDVWELGVNNRCQSSVHMRKRW